MTTKSILPPVTAPGRKSFLPTGDSAPADIPAESWIDWVFTFGSGHRAHALGRHRDLGSLSGPAPTGFQLSDRYVIINGTWRGARARMVQVFGPVWSHQYPSLDEACVEAYGLTELVITGDWPPAAVIAL